MIVAGEHLTSLQREHSDISIQIRWYPVYKDVLSSEKTDEWVKIIIEEPDTYVLKWLRYKDGQPRLILLPRLFRHYKWEISAKKWTEI